MNTESSRISEIWVGFLACSTTISKNTYLKLWKITFQGCTMTAFHVLSPWNFFFKRTFKNFAKAAFLLWKKPAYLEEQRHLTMWSARQQNCLQGKQAFFSHFPLHSLPSSFSIHLFLNDKARLSLPVSPYQDKFPKSWWMLSD